MEKNDNVTVRTIYSGFQLCPDLKPGYWCIRLMKYSSGSGPAYKKLFHEHIRKHRLREDTTTQLLRALVLVYSGIEAPGIVRSYLNGRGDDPPPDPRLQITTEYPERGVVRKYCGGNVQAWVDTIVGAHLFRKPDEDLSHKGVNFATQFLAASFRLVRPFLLSKI